MNLPSANSVFPTNAMVPAPLPAIVTRWSSRKEVVEAILSPERTMIKNQSESALLTLTLLYVSNRMRPLSLMLSPSQSDLTTAVSLQSCSMEKWSISQSKVSDTYWHSYPASRSFLHRRHALQSPWWRPLLTTRIPLWFPRSQPYVSE